MMTSDALVDDDDGKMLSTKVQYVVKLSWASLM